MREKITSQSPARIIALQYLSFALTKLFFLASRSKIIATDNWQVEAGRHYVIASTHVSWLDPFLATTALDWRHLRPLLPCRFMATPYFMQRPFLGGLMLWLGAYPSHPFKDLLYGLEASHALLQKSQTVVIFPQGKRNRADHKVHRGVAELAQHPGALVVPVLIQSQKRFLGLPSYTIYTGKPFDASEQSAEEIMAQVFELSQLALRPRMA